MLLEHDGRERDRDRHFDRDEQRGRRGPDEPDALEKRRDREDRADERSADEADEPGGPPTVPSEPSSAACDEERRRGARGQVRGERDRVGVTQEPIGEQDVDRVRGGGAQRHRRPRRRSGFAAAPPTSATPPKIPASASEAAARQTLTADHRRDADDEHEVGVVHEGGERCRRALERAEEERRVECVDDGTEHEGAEGGLSGTRNILRPRDPDEQDGCSEVPPGEHAGDGGAMAVGDLNQDRGDRERDSGDEAEERAAEVRELEAGPCIQMYGWLNKKPYLSYLL